MSPSSKKKNRFESTPVEGRIDVLLYKVSEAAVRQVEVKIGIAGLWDTIKNDVEELVHTNITKYAVYSPREVMESSWWNYAATLLEASRKKGNM